MSNQYFVGRYLYDLSNFENIGNNWFIYPEGDGCFTVYETIDSFKEKTGIHNIRVVKSNIGDVIVNGEFLYLFSEATGIPRLILVTDTTNIDSIVNFFITKNKIEKKLTDDDRFQHSRELLEYNLKQQLRRIIHFATEHELSISRLLSEIVDENPINFIKS